MKFVSTAFGYAFVIAVGEVLAAWHRYSVASCLIIAAIFGVIALTLYWLAGRKVSA